MAKEVNGYTDIPLRNPIEIDGAKVTSLRMREPTVADQLIADESGGSDAHKEITMLANLCMITPDDVKKIKLRDYLKTKQAFMDFLA